MSESKLSFSDYLLVPGALLAIMTNTDEDGDDPGSSLLDRLQNAILFARAQPLDVYLGSRFL